MKEREIEGALPSKQNRRSEDRSIRSCVFQTEHFVHPEALMTNAVERQKKIDEENERQRREARTRVRVFLSCSRPHRSFPLLSARRGEVRSNAERYKREESAQHRLRAPAGSLLFHG